MDAARRAALVMPAERASGKTSLSKRAKRRRIQTPSSASPVLPSEIGSAVPAPPVIRLAAKAPRRIAGKSRGPVRARKARAKPDAGQTGDALSCRVEKSRPRRASAK